MKKKGRDKIRDNKRPKEDDTGQQREQILRNKVGGERRSSGSTFRGKERCRLYLEKMCLLNRLVTITPLCFCLEKEGLTDRLRRREGGKEQITSMFVR